MAKDKDVRPIIKLKSTAGTGYTYVTRKNRRNDPDRMVLMKYDPKIRNQRLLELEALGRVALNNDLALLVASNL